jgi:hypothetical protein
MDALDEALGRAKALFLEDLSDAGDAETADMLSALMQAGYAREWGHSPTGSFWSFTDAGNERAAELGGD